MGLRLSALSENSAETLETLQPLARSYRVMGGAAEQLLENLRSASVPGWAPLFDANVLSERVSTGAIVTAGRLSRLSFTGLLTAGQ
jgi:hypothetical protein